MALATSCSPFHSEASMSCTLRPGLSRRELTARGFLPTERMSSTVNRVTNMGCSAGKRSISRAISIVGGPPCRAWSDHGLSAASVGTNRSPSGSKIADAMGLLPRPYREVSAGGCESFAAPTTTVILWIALFWTPSRFQLCSLGCTLPAASVARTHSS